MNFVLKKDAKFLFSVVSYINNFPDCITFLLLLVQSKVCLKLLAFDLLELLLLSAFPEMDYIFKQLHEEKHKFGEYRPN